MDELPRMLGICAERVARAQGWITPVLSAIDGVTAEEAAWRPAPDARSIGEIAAHMAAWTDWAVRFLDGEDTEVDDWPAFLDSADPESWNAAQERLRERLDAFAARIAETPADRMGAAPTPDATPTPAFLGIQSILIHNAYHAGQIVVLRDAFARRGL